MALSTGFVDRHIAQWEDWCRQKQNYPHRVRWPSRLFHHSPIENAVTILTTGMLRSRGDPENVRSRDVAGAGLLTREWTHTTQLGFIFVHEHRHNSTLKA
jgi:hypothetical protein